jgi:hypothetical protein
MSLRPPTPNQVLVALVAFGTFTLSLAIYLHCWSAR